MYTYVGRYGLPWHKVLNAVVAELSIHKLKNHAFSVTLSFALVRQIFIQ